MTMQRGDLSEGQTEQEIKNLRADVAPRLTPADIDNAIEAEHYWLVPGTTTIVCCLTLRNGFTVVGHAACASRENFRHEIGRKIAFDKAREQIWQLEGYRLRQLMWEQEERSRAVAEATAGNVERIMDDISEQQAQAIGERIMREALATGASAVMVHPDGKIERVVIHEAGTLEDGEELEPALPLGLA